MREKCIHQFWQESSHLRDQGAQIAHSWSGEGGGFSHRGNASWDGLGPKHVQVINSCLGTFNKAFLKLFLYWFCAPRQLFWCHVLAKAIVQWRWENQPRYCSVTKLIVSCQWASQKTFLNHLISQKFFKLSSYPSLAESQSGIKDSQNVNEDISMIIRRALLTKWSHFSWRGKDPHASLDFVNLFQLIYSLLLMQKLSSTQNSSR